MTPHSPTRRAFLKAGAAALTGAIIAPERILADPYAPLDLRPG
ncbi:MAG: twin-arginine translocation signal domain-containing protein, partial [Gemmatimonadetes bacterium]|nr:twin-arginine translocation signal domain-containing protein [Gemmatimonadota bacterium]